MWAGTFNMDGIVQAQKHHVWLLNGFVFNPLLFPMWVMFLISGMAETQRAPFDLTEAESELVAGYQTEYSSMSFALYWLGEYANVLLMCALNAVLFFGGYLPPLDWAPLYWIPGWIWLFAKILFFFFVFSWVKATVPRYRYDQLMRLGWKVFLPVSLGFVVVVSGYLMLTRDESLEHMRTVSSLKTLAHHSFACDLPEPSAVQSRQFDRFNLVIERTQMGDMGLESWTIQPFGVLAPVELLEMNGAVRFYAPATSNYGMLSLRQIGAKDSDQFEIASRVRTGTTFVKRAGHCRHFADASWGDLK
jgi:NADH dehydrogenase